MTVLSPVENYGPPVEPMWLVPPGLQPLPATAANPPTLLAQANPGGQPGPSWTDILGNVASAGAPDAIVYSNAALLAPANAKSFVLANPLTGGYTQFISHPQNTVTVGGVPFGRVEAIHYSATGAGTRREDGFGKSWTLGAGQNAVTLFINGRAGDTNLLNNPNNGVSVNFGFFGSPAAVRQLIDRLPAGGRAGKVKEALEAVLATAAAGGTKLGLAWRGTLQMNRDTGKAELNVSGVKIPLADLQAAMRDVNAINYGDKPIARVNNEEAYLRGANPFQRADDTRVPGGAYVNHTDPVAAIAGDVLTLQDRLDGAPTAKIRTNDEARRLLEYAIERSTWLTPAERRRYGNVDGIETARVDPNPMSAEDKAKLQGLLVQLHRYGLYFGSERIEAAAREAAGTNAPPVDRESRAFVRAVFQGKFRYASLEGYDAGDLARDVALGLNRWTAVITEVFRAEPTARDDIMLEQWRNLTDGFSERMNREGGTLRALGLRVPEGVSTTDAERYATASLIGELAPRVQSAGRAVSAQSLYDQFQQLGSAQRQAIAREIQGGLNARAGGAGLVGSTGTVDGVAITGSPSRVEAVGGINRSSGAALQGDLMWARSPNGGLVFWLQGRSTNYVLRDASGALITSQSDAKARARELISTGAATDLRALPAQFR